MSDYENLYQSPSTETAPDDNTAEKGRELTSLAKQYLRESSPWLKFLGVMTYVGAGLMIGGGLITMVAMSVASAFTSGMEDFDSMDGLGIMGAAFGLLYVGFGVLMIFPAGYLYKYGEKISKFMDSGSPLELETAFKNAKSLFKFYGIFMIVYLCLAVLFVLFSIVVGVLGSI